ncbi:radical SAM protein [Palleronia caenipelagi]|uniref:radical SAM protein n=1 Tax=Palleronia caenipelagi TaxID=2489174 RepID=UPI001C8F2572|nr:radical SAM protein [Palleronia caenipelagi]
MRQALELLQFPLLLQSGWLSPWPFHTNSNVVQTSSDGLERQQAPSFDGDVGKSNIVTPVYLAIHLTYKCPASCSHCCFSSGPDVNDTIDVSTASRAIDEASLIKSIKMVGFTGGEPLLYPRELRVLISQAKEYGFQTRIVTSAAWAKNKRKANQILSSLKEAGLDEISLSYDDAHAEFISEESIVNCVRSAVDNGIPIALNVCVDESTEISGQSLRALFLNESIDISAVYIQETLINTTGRAREIDLDRTSDPRRLVGPCDHVLRGPTVNPFGRILPCCGTIPFYQGLQIGDMRNSTVVESISAAFEDPIINWIAFEGPAAIVECASKNTSNPQMAKDFDSNCEACAALFSRPEVLDNARRIAQQDKKKSLATQRLIYQLAGTYRAPEISSSIDEE